MSADERGAVGGRGVGWVDSDCCIISGGVGGGEDQVCLILSAGEYGAVNLGAAVDGELFGDCRVWFRHAVRVDGTQDECGEDQHECHRNNDGAELVQSAESGMPWSRWQLLV